MLFCLARLFECFQPNSGFFENVGSIASQPESWKRVFSTLVDYGYEFKWVVIPVPDGLIYRQRFFMFAKRTCVSRFPIMQALRAELARVPPWDADIPNPEECTLPRNSYPCVKSRLTMLGNIVVPRQGRYAFSFLCG